MELRHLRYFTAVARERSFTRASALLNIAQPPLSRQIQQLERELGVDLIDRRARPLELTEAGRLIYEQAAQILERVDDMRALARRMQDSGRNVFRVGFVASTLYGKLPDVIRAYRAGRPSTELVLSEMVTLEQIAALKEGRIDVGFGRIPLDDPAIVRLLLRNERLIVALPGEHPLAGRAETPNIADLRAEDVVVYPRMPRPSYADQVLAIFRDRNIRPARIHEVRELQTALGLVAAGLGVCLVPAAVQRFRRDNVVYRDLDEAGIVSPIFMSYRAGDTSSEIAHVVQLIQDMYRRDGILFGQ